ncbi:MAG: hypothetical protein ACHQX1_00505 [Candidatus Micrarchaeales archaeon]
MAGTIELDELREQLGYKIDMLEELKNNARSIKKANSELDKFFNGISSKSVLLGKNGDADIGALFNKLNETGFMKARKLGRSYKPYKVQIVKKRKGKIMSAELKTVVSGGLTGLVRASTPERQQPAPPALRTAGEREGVQGSTTEFQAYRRGIQELAHELFPNINRIATSIFGEGIKEPQYVFESKITEGGGGMAYRGNGLDKNVIVISDDIMFQKYKAYADLRKKGFTDAEFEQKMAHELAHQINTRILGTAPDERKSLDERKAWKWVNEACAELIGTYVIQERKGSNTPERDAAAVLLYKIALTSEKTSAALGGWAEAARKAEREHDPKITRMVGDAKRRLDATETNMFLDDINYSMPVIVLCKMLLESNTTLPDFVKGVLSKPKDFNPEDKLPRSLRIATSQYFSGVTKGWEIESSEVNATIQRAEFISKFEKTLALAANSVLNKL